MVNKQATYNKILFAACLSIAIAIALSSSASADYINASIIRVDNNVTQNVYYYAAGGGYKDNVGVTPDTKLRVCADLAADLSGKGAAAFYVMAPNNSTIFIYDILGGDTIARYVLFGAPFAFAGKFCADANFEFYAGRAPCKNIRRSRRQRKRRRKHRCRRRSHSSTINKRLPAIRIHQKQRTGNLQSRHRKHHNRRNSNKPCSQPDSKHKTVSRLVHR